MRLAAFHARRSCRMASRNAVSRPGQRLIQQKQSRLCHQGARQGDALLFAAGEFAGLTRAQRLDVKRGENAIDALLAVRGRKCGEAIGDIFFHRKMGEERERLKNIGGAAVLRREGKPASAIVKQILVQFDEAIIRTKQTGDAIEQGGLPCPGRTKKDREARGKCLP